MYVPVLCGRRGCEIPARCRARGDVGVSRPSAFREELRDGLELTWCECRVGECRQIRLHGREGAVERD
jgi:hypothetical protein